jgi:hypothetical protein
MHQLAAQEQLNPASLILDMTKGQGALLAPGHESPRDSDFLAVMARKLIDNPFGVRRAMTARRIGIEPQLPQRGGFFQPNVPNIR